MSGDTHWLTSYNAIAAIDSLYGVIGTVFYKMALDDKEATDARVSGHCLCTQIQNIEFVYL